MMRQRVIDAINHKQTDVTPWQIDMTSAFAKKLCDAAGCDDADKYLGNHLLRAKYKQNKKLPDGREVDIFGATWTKSDDGGDIGVVTGFPLADPDAEYEMPALREDFLRQLTGQLENDDTGRFRMFALTMLYYERAWSLRGIENVLVDMALNEKATSRLLGRILEHHMELLDKVLDADFEAVYFGDDWGQQRGLIMGPDMWRKFIKPGIGKLYAKVKAKGKFVVQHSCGDIREVMGDLIDMGMDVYNTVQPEIYDLKKLKKEYGRDLTFYGGISTQQFLPTATAEQSRDMGSWMLDVMGKDGGFIFAPTHSVTPDIPVDNILALADVVKNRSWR